PVGVFVNQPLEYVNRVATLVRLGAVQLHGEEPLSYATALARPVIKAIPLSDLTPDVSLGVDAWPDRVTLLLDVHDLERRGGTGRTVDWTMASSIARRRRVMLAGGLTPDNVVDAVARVQPDGIDVSSGVEQAPGIKDPVRIT